MDKQGKQKLTGAMWLEFLGSMYLAITLLVVVAIASIIGTVLQQNQAYSDYLIKFGPFWFEVFQRMGLYDVYGSLWFLVILTFLLISTTTCIWRNTPHMLREMRRFGLNTQKKSLQAFHSKKEWQVELSSDQVEQQAGELLQKKGFQVRRKAHDDHVIIAAKKGSMNRAGYLLTHVAMVIILVAAFIDGTFDLKFKEMLGLVKVETRGVTTWDELDDRTILKVGSGSFRGSVKIPEGGDMDYVRINVRDGFLIQRLPFDIELKDFRIEHYNTGQPKSFESDLVIHDPESNAPLSTTISVNHPLIYKGYAIYQSGFEDGGSKLKLRILPLMNSEPFEVESAVFESVPLLMSTGNLTLEFNDFRLYNIQDLSSADVKQPKLTNVGPSIVFKVRDEQGQALEFQNYMNPIPLEGRYYFISGVRTSVSEPMRYIHIPMDPNGTMNRFINFRHALLDEGRLYLHAQKFVASNLSKEPQEKQAAIIANMISLVGRFNDGGYEALQRAAEQQGGDSQNAMRAYVNLLDYMQREIYKDILRSEGVDISEGVGADDVSFFNAAQDALATLPVYGTPFIIQLAGFEHVEATVLQVTRSPAKSIVYLGCVLLIIGIFVMFYIPHIRVWLWLENQQGKVSLILAGSTNRDRRDFEQQFAQLSEQLDARLKA